ncbi:hypothetical protein FRC03_005396 [Tulasnella sp. 419]|nr:hypothetical protein FRC02_010935 [Tulasnella sp. 418]KAG8961422.1 hypothetical protein FRC03_005396 [Tulasnella sp. 419]
MKFEKRQNKDRLYIAYLFRSARPDQIKFHTALQLIPKHADARSTSETGSWVYHAVDPIRPDGSTAWEYKPKQTQVREIRLWSLLLLGKVKPGFTGDYIMEKLKEVEIEQNDRNWKCHNWAFAAIQLLVDEGIIPPLTTLESAEAVWRRGFEFGEKCIADPDKSVPTCDVFGMQINSEIGPMR